MRKALNDAVPLELVSINVAHHFKISYDKPRPMVWTAERVAAWRRTGVRPSPVMVWTPEQAGQFLDGVAEDPLYALWHLAVIRGPRRGELCGVSWTEAAEDYRSLEVLTQLTEVDYEVAEESPKSEAGFRTIPLDAESGEVLRAHRLRQNKHRLEIGELWTDTGYIFTRDDGQPLRPSYVSDRFERIVRDLDLPPVRFHDLRHTAATISLKAGTDMKVVQVLLGHSSLSVTSDIYTSVLPELATAAAEASAAVVANTRRRAMGTQ